MSAATLTRGARSAYPRAVEDLLPQAREYAAELGTEPSRNQLMKRFRVGDKKAKALLAALSAGPAEPPPLRPIVIVEDETQKFYDASAVAAPAAPAPVEQVAVESPPVAEIPPAPAAVESADAPVSEDAPMVLARRRPVVWPVLILCLPAFVAIWAGWVEMGRLTGFGKVVLLPGIADRFVLDTAITLPIGVETYAAYALWVWLSGRAPAVARRFAKRSAILSLAIGGLGQIAYHLMTAWQWSAAPWPITAVVACIPVAVLGMGAALAHLMHHDH